MTMTSYDLRGATQVDLDRITHPLRLAKDSYRPNLGEASAMNAIAYICGEPQLTDFNARSGPRTSVTKK